MDLINLLILGIVITLLLQYIGVIKNYRVSLWSILYPFLNLIRFLIFITLDILFVLFMQYKVNDDFVGNMIVIVFVVILVCLILAYLYSIISLIIGKSKSKLLNKKEIQKEINTASEKTLQENKDIIQNNKKIVQKQLFNNIFKRLNSKKNQIVYELHKNIHGVAEENKVDTKRKKGFNKILVTIPIIVIIIGFVALNNKTVLFNNLPVKNTGKYLYYINDVVVNRTKELRKIKYIEDSYNTIYTNVIYENEINKQDMLQISNGKNVAEYLICVIDEYDIDNNGEIVKDIKEPNFYLCSVSKNNFRQVVKDQLVGNKDILESLIKKGAAGAAGGAIVGSMGGAVVIPIIGSVPGAVGGAITGLIGGVATDVVEKFLDGDSGLDDLINEISEENYMETYESFAEYYDPKITKISVDDLYEYIPGNEVNAVDSVVKRYCK